MHRQHPGRRGRRQLSDAPGAALIALGLALAPACGSESGVLVVVSGPAVDTLEFQVGIVGPEQIVLDRGASGQRREVKGRNLQAHPYELLITDEAPAEGRTVRVLVLGERDGEAEVFGFTDPAQGFAEGKVFRRNVELWSPRSSDPVRRVSRPGGCFEVVVGDREGQVSRWTLVAPEDRDCDGHGPSDDPPDCDDADPQVHPGATELCDGKDNDCDGQPAPPTQVCYARLGPSPVCREGTRACNEAEGGGLASSCAVDAGGTRVPDAYCEAYEDCTDVDPLGCVATKVKRTIGECTLERANGELCGAAVVLNPPVKATTCRWEVVDAAGFPIGLRVGGAGEPGATAQVCEPELVVEAGPGPSSGTVVLEFFGDPDTPSVVIEVAVSTQAVAECSTNPLECHVGS